MKEPKVEKRGGAKTGGEKQEGTEVWGLGREKGEGTFGTQPF